MKAAVLGASGYIGGEVLRLLLGHPRVELVQATSARFAGKPLSVVHPNLRGQTDLRFRRHEDLAPCDVLFLAAPHGVSKDLITWAAALAPRLLDLSADFRLHTPSDYETHYGWSHPAPAWLERFVPGLPELYRQTIREAALLAIPGCMATAAILALYPLAQAGLAAGRVLIDARTGSSGSGAQASAASHHAARSGVMRVFQPAGHRHQAEIRQASGLDVLMTATAVEPVRGAQVLCHVPLVRACDEKEIWQLYRRHYGEEPFVRIVRERQGLFRLPEPKILAGTNFCDVGFAISADGLHLTAIAALDNLVKGGAGNAVQCLNLLAGWDETLGLEFFGLYPL